MEEVLKVSIGGVPFIINRDGFNRLDTYLRGIESYYSSRPGGKEIVDDIESRIAELLLEKHTKEDVVNLERVEDMISVMGTPNQFEDEPDNEGGQAEEHNQGARESSQRYYSAPASPKRRLFRDRQDRMIGGVCSGIAHYFKFDPSILRIILAVIVVLHFLARGFWWPSVFRIHILPSLFTISLIGYIILWIVVPSAKTYTQRCQMTGSDPGIRGAEESYSSSQRPTGWWLGRLAKVLLGLFFIFMGLFMLLLAGGALAGSDSLFGSNPIRALSLLDMNPWLRVLLKVSFVLVVMIPCIVFLYLGIRWLFNLKRPKYHPGLLMFVLWILAVVVCSVLAGRASDLWPGSGGRMAYQTKTFPKYYDTMYVEYAALPETVEGNTVTWQKIQDRFHRRLRHSAGMYVSWNGKPIDDYQDKDEYTIDSEGSFDGDYFLFVSEGKTKAYAVYPRLEVDHKGSTAIEEEDYISAEDSTVTFVPRRITKDTTIRADLEISAGTVSFLRGKKNSEDKSEKTRTLVEVKDSLIRLNPTFISKNNKYDGTYINARLCIPDSSVVIIKTPVSK